MDSQNWISQHNPFLSQKDLFKDYETFFNETLVYELNDWKKKELGDSILKRNINLLNAKIELELDAVTAPFQNIDQQVKTDFRDRINFSINDMIDDFTGLGGFLGGLGLGSMLAAGLLMFTPLGTVAVVTASIAAAIGGSFGLNMLDLDNLREQIKAKVLELGFQNFETSKDKIFEKVYEIVKSAIDHKVQLASHNIKQAILLHESSLEQQDKVYQETLEQCETKKAAIDQKCEELKQLQINTEKECS